MARRLPVLQELLQGDSCGVLVGSVDWANNSNTVDSQELADALSELLEDVDKQNLLGQNCFEVSSNFVWGKVVQDYEVALATAVSDYSAISNQ